MKNIFKTKKILKKKHEISESKKTQDYTIPYTSEHEIRDSIKNGNLYLLKKIKILKLN